MSYAIVLIVVFAETALVYTNEDINQQPWLPVFATHLEYYQVATVVKAAISLIVFILTVSYRVGWNRYYFYQDNRLLLSSRLDSETVESMRSVRADANM